MPADIKKVQPEEGESADIVSENIERLKELFPDAFTEEGINFGTLRQALGDVSVLDEGEEKFGLNWHGKKNARQIALTPSTGTLLPCPEESVDWETTKNLFIEGDNLEVLKLLQKSYTNKIKLIYIDPPYNTGKEFIYPDNYQDDLGTYLRYTGQVDSEGLKFSTNTESTGRKHTNWLNMMYPRLRLAKNLLCPEGLIFISIDENEVSNLRLIANEIFGEECFLGAISRATGTPTGGGNDSLVGEIDYLLVYGKLPNTPILGVNFTDEDASIYNKVDQAGRRYLTRTIRRTGGEDRREDRPSMYYAITDPDGGLIYPIAPSGYESRWICGRDTFEEMEKTGLIEWALTGKNGEKVWAPYQKYYLEGRKKQPSNLWTKLEGNKKATRELRDLFDGNKVFTFPKPVGLIQNILEISGLSEGDIVLDFFAGSGTTAEAAMRYAMSSGLQCRYILVQLPEKLAEIDKEVGVAAKFCEEHGLEKNIAALCRQRLIRASKKIEDENADAGCLGFKAFKLSTSNIPIWNPDRTDLEESLLSHQDHLVEGRTEQEVLYELLIKRGVDLAAPIEERKVSGKNIYSIGYGVLLACLDELITKEQVEVIGQGIVDWHGELAPSSDTHVFFRDSAFRDDVSKTNMAAILEQNGISHVRSL